MAWLKNTDGKESSSFTMMIIAFTVVTLWLALSIATKIGPVSIRPFSGTEAMAYLTPILALYWGRRQQEIGVKTLTAASTTLPVAQPVVVAAAPATTMADVSAAPTCGCECDCCSSCEKCNA